LCQVGTRLADTDERLYTGWVLEETTQGSYPISRRIVKFNPYTGQKRELMQDEIERIVEITSDGRYTIMLMDDNGQIDILPQDNTFAIDLDLPVNFRFVIINLATGNIVYEAATNTSRTHHGYWFTGFFETTGEMGKAYIDLNRFSITDNLFYIGNNTFIHELVHNQTSVYSLIQIGETLKENPIDQPVLLMPDGQKLITMRQDGENHYVYMTYDMLTGTSMPLLKVGNISLWGDMRLDKHPYELKLQRGNQPDMLQFILYHRDTHDATTYTVQLPP
jgi:hypothetical protein